ncbi:hypothetical protein UFOVP1654_6 [uncultured Caudovirales phage]|uniref:Uncharacterized protein n=1 Tax=uncultured Caudovirales phage TaxID=2100421 RepID=A0A6J5Q9K6_9CAUD|nr:hypothetical protein UFOVP878_13 [uncultured Caudovirales phage]CAB4180192.1 hypothetical protein UFOVP1044_11 [uncultured Caudovirales phage]CAB4222085.1 hypothetical protein UFOVP1654_6 [uncultured Caudovirales phage]
MEMANDKITIKPDLSDYRGLLKAISKMDKDSQGALKGEVASISSWTAQGMAMAAYSAPMSRQSVIVASTIRANKDRIPNVTIGGSKGRASGGANAGQLLFGNEFGSDRNIKGSKGSFPNGGYRFPDRSPSQGRGNAGYWIFPTLKAMQPEITRRWLDAVTKVMDNWARTS